MTGENWLLVIDEPLGFKIKKQPVAVEDFKGKRSILWMTNI